MSSNQWLNDNLIGFYFEYLQHTLFHTQGKLLFIGPEVSQFLKLVARDEVTSVLEPATWERAELVLLAVNSLNRRDVAGGAHWSLLGRCHFFDLQEL